MKTALCALLFTVGLYPARGQIAQSHPEYCGIPGDASPPLPDIWATSDSTEPLRSFVLYIGRGGSARGIPLMSGHHPALISEIAAVCPLPDGRLVVFGDIQGVTAAFIVDTARASLVDSFAAWWPAMSPDQRWIAYQKGGPLHSVDISSELLIYDLTKTPAQNRLGDDLAGAGRLIFPPGQSDVPFDNINLPRDQIHRIGRRVYWADDSRALLFTDRLANNPKSIVLVTLDDQGKPSALEHPITELCGREITTEGPEPRLERVEIGPDRAGSRTIVLDFGYPWGRHCVMQFSKDDFQPTKPEVHVREEPTAGMKREGYPDIPPRKRKK